MSLLLNGTSQYAHAAMNVTAYPFGIAGWVKNDDDSLSRWVAALSQTTNGNRLGAAQLSTTSLLARDQRHGVGQGFASQAGISEAAWEPFAVWFDGFASRWAYTNDGSNHNTTSIGAIPSPVNIFTVGANQTDGVPADQFFDGRIAHIFTFEADPAGWFAGFAGGAYPLSLAASITHYWPLLTDYTDLIAGLTLTGESSPMFDPDNPPVLAPGGGSGISRSRLVNAGAG